MKIIMINIKIIMIFIKYLNYHTIFMLKTHVFSAIT